MQPSRTLVSLIFFHTDVVLHRYVGIYLQTRDPIPSTLLHVGKIMDFWAKKNWRYICRPDSMEISSWVMPVRCDRCDILKYGPFRDLLRYSCRWSHVARTMNMDVSENNGTPKSSILIGGFCFINHPFWGIPIFGITHIDMHGHHGPFDHWIVILPDQIGKELSILDLLVSICVYILGCSWKLVTS